MVRNSGKLMEKAIMLLTVTQTGLWKLNSHEVAVAIELRLISESTFSLYGAIAL